MHEALRALHRDDAGGVLATDSPSAPQILSFAPATDDPDTSLDYQVKILQGGTEVYATTTKATSVELTGENKLADNANYSWMVQAVDSKGAVSGFSPAAAFTVNINDPPGLPVPQTPVGSSVVESDAPALTYAAATDDNDTQLTYQVEVKQGGVVVYAASSTTSSLVVPAGTLQGVNDWHRPGYGGPCPPVGRHRYFHKLYALDVKLPDLKHPSKGAVEKAMHGHVLAQAELVGLYQKRGG